MADSKKYLDFLPEKEEQERRHESAPENSNPPIDSGETETPASEQVLRTQKSENCRKYESIVKDTKNDMYGEEIMRKYNFKRRRDLESFLYSASLILDKPLIKINYETNFENKEKPLHPLKIAKDGSLRISAKQIKRRAKIDAPEGTEFIIIPFDDGDNEEGFKIIKLKKTINTI